MTLYVDSWAYPWRLPDGRRVLLHHMLADVPSELDAAAHALGAGERVRERGRPWAFAEIFDDERAAALQRGARPVEADIALRELARRVAAFRWPGGRQPTPFDHLFEAAAAEVAARAAAAPVEEPPEPGLIRHDPPLRHLFDAAAGPTPGVFVCKRSPAPAKWNPARPQHAWEEPKEAWHRCIRCRVLYRSVRVAGQGWGRQWERPDGWGGIATSGVQFPKCTGPVTRPGSADAPTVGRAGAGG